MTSSTLHRLRRLGVIAGFLAVFGGFGAIASAQTAASEPPVPPLRKTVPFTLIPGDRVSISIFQEPDLSTISRVDANGCVNLNLVEAVRVHGLTLARAQEVIATAYREGRFLRNPQVTINLEEAYPREVAIQGAVNNPNRYTLPLDSVMTVADLVMKAGGFKDTAKGTAVRVTRLTPDLKKVTFEVDVDSLIKGKDKANVEDNSLVLRPGDIVYVDQRII